MIRSLVLVLAASLSTAALAQPAPPPVQGIDIVEHLGDKLPTGLTFLDADGQQVRLQDYIKGDKPVVIVPAYFECQTLCNLVLTGVGRAVERMDWKPGDQYRVVTVSFDPRDDQVSANKKRTSILGRLEEKKVGPEDWAFLTGEPSSIQPFLDALGYKVVWDEKTRQFAHGAAIVVLAPDGTISRYLYGVEFPTRDFKLALLEASDGKVGTTVDRVLLSCFRYDPSTRRYGLFISNLFKVGGAVIGLVVFGGVAMLFRLERKRTKRA